MDFDKFEANKLMLEKILQNNTFKLIKNYLMDLYINQHIIETI
jgi:hypothetical protein